MTAAARGSPRTNAAPAPAPRPFALLRCPPASASRDGAAGPAALALMSGPSLGRNNPLIRIGRSGERIGAILPGTTAPPPSINRPVDRGHGPTQRQPGQPTM